MKPSTRINGKKVSAIGSDAFFAKQLTGVTIPGDVTEIGQAAFCRNRLTSVTIPEGVTTIEALAFANNRLTSVTLAKSVTAIAGFAFADNQQMSGMVRPGVIDPAVDNQITSVTIGADVALGTNDEGQTFPAFSGGFDDFYNNNGKKAGTYTYRNGKWRFKR